VSGIFGGRPKRSERGKGKESASPQARRMQAREVLKPKRAWAPLGPEFWIGRGMHGWPRERKPPERRCQAEGFGEEA